MKNKKKLIVFAVVVIMVLTLCITALVGCNKDKGVPKGYHKLGKDQTVSFESILGSAVANAVENNGLDALKFGTELAVNTKYGNSEQKFLIKMDANLSFNAANTDTNRFSFQVKDAAANANLLAVYYREFGTVADATDDPTDPANIGQGEVYIAVGSGSNAKYFKVNALGIKSVLRTQWISGGVDASGNALPQVHPSIDAEGATEVGDSITGFLEDSVYSIIDMIAGVGEIFEGNNKDSYIVRLDVSKLLNDDGVKELLGSASEQFNAIAEALGLKIQFEALNELLPKLVLDVNFDFANVDSSAADPFEASEFAGIGVALNVKQKDFSLKRVDDSDFVRINIANDFTADAKFKFSYGDAVNVPTNPVVGGSSDYGAAINAVNFKTKGELKLNEGINLEIALSAGAEKQTLIIPEGTYNITVEADLDPTKLIGMSFNTDGSLGQIVNLVVDILNNVVKTAKLEIVNKTDTSKKLLLSIQATSAGLHVNIDTSLIEGTLIGSFGSIINLLNDQDITPELIDSLLGMINGFTAETEDKVGGLIPVEIANTIKGVINNLTIVANAGKLTVDLKNMTVATTPDKPNTTLDANVAIDKAAGLVITAALKNIIASGTPVNVNATVTANDNGIKIVAKSTDPTTGSAAPIKVNDDIAIPVDLELTITEFVYGGCGK